MAKPDELRHESSDEPAPLYALINPVAGGCDAAALREALISTCRTSGRTLEIHETTGADDFPALIEAAWQRGFRRFAAAGGDGTVAAVATPLLDRHGAELAILPVGTANKLARELAVPLVPEEACELAAAGHHCRRIDAMRCDGQLFFCHISLGMYSRIAQKTSALAKRHLRQLAYVWNAIPELLGRRSWRFELEVDGETLYPRAAFVVITNIATVGAGELSWGPDIAPDDGRVDLCIVRARSMGDYLRIVWHVLLNRHQSLPALNYLCAEQRIRVSTRRRRVPIQADGDTLPLSSLTIDVLPRCVAIVVPEPTASEDAVAG